MPGLDTVHGADVGSVLLEPERSPVVLRRMLGRRRKVTHDTIVGMAEAIDD
jgi:hypothetical protein